LGRGVRGRRARAAALGGLCAALFAGCGGGFPRAAEPAESPPPADRPAGTVARIGKLPEGLVFLPGADLLAVGLRNPSALGFVDPETLAVVRRLPLPATPRHLAVSPSGGGVIVPAESADAVLRISPGGRIASTAVGEHPHDATAAAGGRFFVADEFSDEVSVLRGRRLVATLPAPAQPGGIAAGGGYVALVAVAERVLQVYDARRPRALGRAPAGIGPTHVVTLGADAFVADTEGGLVRRYRLGPRPRETAVARAPGAPYGIAVDPGRRRLWVTLTATNRLVGYSIAGGRPTETATYPTVRQPNSVAVDPRSGEVFVAGRDEGQLQRVEPAGEER